MTNNNQKTFYITTTLPYVNDFWESSRAMRREKLSKNADMSAKHTTPFTLTKA
jgi:hypothetical protein